MKVCFITPEYPTKPPFGGIATYVQTTARWLSRHGHSTYVLCILRVCPNTRETDEGVCVEYVPPKRLRPRRLLRWAYRLTKMDMLNEAYAGWNRMEDSCGIWKATRRLATDWQPDIIEVADYAGLGWWYVNWPGRKIPVVVRGHFLTDFANGNWPGSRFQYWMECATARRADLVLTNSTTLKQRYLDEVGISQDRIQVLPLSFDLALLESETPRAQPRAETPTILFVGWLDFIKGCDILFAALYEVKKRVPALRVILIGSITERFENQAKAFLQATTDWVEHYNNLPQKTVFNFMRQATLVVMPSRVEPFGRVAVEAQLNGAPVIASRAGGLTEIIEDGVTGILVPPEDVDALVSAMLRLLEAPILAETMGKHAQERAKALYSTDALMPKQVDIYWQLVKAYRDHASAISEDNP